MKEFIPLLIVFIVAFTTLAIVLLAHLDDILDTYTHFKDWEDRRKKELKKNVD